MILALLVVVRLIGWLRLDYGPLNNPLGWLAVASLIIMPILVIVLPRFTKEKPDRLLLLRLSISEVPFLLTFISVMSEGPQQLVGPAFLESAALVIFSMRSAKNAARRHQPSVPPRPA